MVNIDWLLTLLRRLVRYDNFLQPFADKNSWQFILALFLLGGFGSLIRFIIVQIDRKALHKSLKGVAFGTLIANIIGCTLISSIPVIFHNLLGSYMNFEPYSAQFRGVILLLQVGLCGGISTLSTFASQVALAIKDKHYKQATLYVILTTFVPLIIASVVCGVLSGDV